MCFPEKADGILFQKAATGIGCLLCLNYGILFGITSSNIILYQSTAKSPLLRPIDNEATSLVGTYLCLGGVIGSLIFGYVSSKIGPKTSLLLCGLLQIGSWFCIHFGFNIDHIYSSRLAGGLAAGGAFAVLPTYIKDISEQKNYRILEPIIDFFRNVGILLGFLLASTTPYEYLSIIGLCTSFIFTMFFPFMPESPFYLMRIGDTVMMEKSLRWLRGIRRIDDRNKPEFLDELQNTFGKQKVDEVTLGDVNHKSGLFRQLVVSVVLVVIYQFCGVFLILHYADTILKNLGVSPVTRQWATVMLAGSQLIGSLFNILLQRKITKKPLIAVTTLLSGVLLIVLAALMTFENLIQWNAQELKYTILSILTIFMLTVNIGFYSLTFVVISDISTEKIRGRLISLSTSLMWLLAMVIVKFYYVLNEYIGFAGLLWAFGGFCVFGFFFTIWFLPESNVKQDSAIDGTGSWKSSTSK